MQMALFLALLFGMRGMNVVGIKQAQRGRIYTISDSIVFVTIYSAMQAIFILPMPPYHLLIFDWQFYIWPFCYAVFYFLGNVLLLKSLRLGSASIANTVVSFHCLVVVMISVLFWGETLSAFQIVGLALFAVGLVLYNKSSYTVGEKKQKISMKFLGLVLLSMLSTGVAVIFTRTGMKAFPDYGKQYLFYYAVFAAIIGTVAILCNGRGKTRELLKDKSFLRNTGMASVAINTTNLLFVSYINLFSTTIFIPSFSVIGMLGIMLASRLILKERISRNAIISSVICIVSILLLNL